MKLSARLSSGFSGDWADWRRRDKKDAVVILGVLVLTYVVGTANDWAIKLFRFAADHENGYIDDLLFMDFVLGLAMIVYGFRRYKEYRKAIGCAEGRGYLFSKAIPADDIGALIGRPTNDSIVA